MCYLEKCVPLLSLVEGTPVLYLRYNTYGSYTIGAEKMCKDLWIDRELGICHKGMKSLNKGKECTTDQDCPTNVPSRYAKCRGGFTKDSGKMYCDIEGEDEEWVAAKNAVIIM